MILRIIICFLSTFVANGLARFGYVVLIPIMIISGRLNENQSIQLGIAVLVGYIFGSFFINFLRNFISLENIAKLSFLIISLSFFCLHDGKSTFYMGVAMEIFCWCGKRFFDDTCCTTFFALC